MKLQPTQTEESSLLDLGREAVSLFQRRDFESLASLFGYALAFGNSPVVAIEQDFQACIDEFRASAAERPPVQSSMVVKYLKPNQANLVAVVECVFGTPDGCPILAELVVTSSGQDTYVTLEQVGLPTAWNRIEHPGGGLIVGDG